MPAFTYGSLRSSREGVVIEARSYKGTPYHLGNCVKGAGCDCGSFLIGVYTACGFLKEVDVRELTGDWWNHTREEKYLLLVMRHARKVLETVAYGKIGVEAKPGNIVMTHVENTQRFNHGAIITKWPFGVHAIAPKVCEVNLSLDPMWSFRPIEVFDPWENPA